MLDSRNQEGADEEIRRGVFEVHEQDLFPLHHVPKVQLGFPASDDRAEGLGFEEGNHPERDRLEIESGRNAVPRLATLFGAIGQDRLPPFGRLAKVVNVQEGALLPVLRDLGILVRVEKRADDFVEQGFRPRRALKVKDAQEVVDEVLSLAFVAVGEEVDREGHRRVEIDNVVRP